MTAVQGIPRGMYRGARLYQAHTVTHSTYTRGPLADQADNVGLVGAMAPLALLRAHIDARWLGSDSCERQLPLAPASPCEMRELKAVRRQLRETADAS